MKTTVASDVRGKGLCDLCEGVVQANDEVRYCGRRHKQWGKSGPWGKSGARRVRCNVYVCKVCADGFADGEVVGIRDEGPGGWINDEVHKAAKVESGDQSQGPESIRGGGGRAQEEGFVKGGSQEEEGITP